MSTRRYSVRQLNPFEGVLQVVETNLARAFSVNGTHWQVQVLAERPDHTWRSDNKPGASMQYFLWGYWSASKGMRRVPANPLLDLGAMTKAEEAITPILKAACSELPFPPKDHYECWSCDEYGTPIALLSSSISASQRKHAQPQTWQACPHPEERLKPQAEQADSIFEGATRLEQIVHARTQSQQWFLRLHNGNRRNLSNSHLLEAEQFPNLPLTENWSDNEATDRAKEYLDWLAPLLLALPLSHQDRAHFEEAARARPFLVADLYRTYPQFHNPSLIEQIRVEAKIRRSVKDN